MTTRCPSGHDSTEVDYCSVCGAAMSSGSGAARQSAASSAASSQAQVCPACSEPRADQAARFCEVCRYDFVAQKPGPAPRASLAHGPPSVAMPAAAPAPAPPLAPPSAAARPARSPASVRDPGSAHEYVLVVQVDPSLDTDPDPAQPCPQGATDVLVPFDRPELLVGRRDELRDVHPDIPVSDPGTSRRHAKIVQAIDGSVALVDLASTNGSKLNGVEVPPGSRSPLHVGDEITIGRWTRIRLTVRS